MPSMNVSLTPELLKIVQSKVKSGLYNNASEVIREAIRHLDTNGQLLHELKLAHLRDALAEGVRQVKDRDTVRFSLHDIIRELNVESGA